MSDRASNSSERQDSRQEGAHFKRSMQTRHLVMLSLGGVIGTGLFLSSGYTVQQAGPVGAVLAYLVGGIVAWLVMMCLGELAVHMPDSGAFSAHASRYIGPGTGYMVAWMYWLTWTVALGSEFTAAAVFMGRWFPDIPGWYWSGLFAAVVFGVNAFTSRFFAESEFWLSLIKVIAVVVFVVVGAGAIIGWVPLQDASGASVASPGLSAFWGEGAMSPSLLAIGTTLLAVMFAFSGTELIGIAAGETVDPARNVPKAIRATLWRLILFFVGTIIVIAALLPQSQAGLSQSPFVAVFQRLGVPGAADIMNFVIITALLSAANSGLYASSRMLWTLSDQGTLPKSLGRLNKRGIPMNALLLSMIGGFGALFSSIYAPETVYLVLVSISGLAVVVVWMAIALSQLNFRRQYLREGGRLEDLVYRTPFYPWVPLIAFAACLAACIGIAFDPQQRVALYFGVPFIGLCYLMYFLHQRKAAQPPAYPNTAAEEKRA
ncbi:S-methylmethionine:proton symporter (AAT family) [Vreelandella songnenensis]|uniref:S-methylmethionine:proton symporter (AAT family) n=1 Tax=Vreelandella songnenensis TaxID=1176243 RepID=A0A2T0V076_9GAMM|nr:amino acid permease [Halomonas songnenensis]PRY63498.1 S-methylmethionine:proton symporter (AAT family) [Halomonas songnenensis]